MVNQISTAVSFYKGRPGKNDFFTKRGSLRVDHGISAISFIPREPLSTLPFNQLPNILDISQILGSFIHDYPHAHFTLAPLHVRQGTKFLDPAFGQIRNEIQQRLSRLSAFFPLFVTFDAVKIFYNETRGSRVFLTGENPILIELRQLLLECAIDACGFKPLPNLALALFSYQHQLNDIDAANARLAELIQPYLPLTLTLGNLSLVYHHNNFLSQIIMQEIFAF